ncbi:hypothetical protein E2R51_08270 [Jeotgalibacillus sp. S-D1]|uniref:cell wall-binding repeat-containing protein n=1 Tax=Jeotgalibacillus sp. S-D1 TaxID=2552189 RepID=UPI0010597409|nr:cell wall-binding repeat-containing protein [Jeotgalibacillus sp. S-D1]TDL32668.1 hypothetical protein E2R51_08270 [Jeotgalibacillus sp. S-D1]
MKFTSILITLLFVYVLVPDSQVQSAAGSSSESGKAAIISNESLNSSKTQSTGTFSISELNKKMTTHESLPLEAYRVDKRLMFDPKSADAPLSGIKKNQNILPYKVGDKKKFWVINDTNNEDYQIEAVLKYSGQRGEIWVHNNEITSGQAKEMGKEFDQNIYPLITKNFARESDVDQNSRVSILVFDIQDGFNGSGGYIGGYFYARDLYNMPYSNRSEIFYIDTYPSMGFTKSSYDVSNAYSTIAHEFQHMVNFNQNVLVEKGEEMEVWLDEALAMAAEHMYLKEPLSDRVSYYERSASIPRGHSLLNWDYEGDVLSNYSLSYLFGQYFRIQTQQGDSIYKELIANKKSGTKALEEIIQKYISSNKSLGEFLTDFRQALYLNESGGLYGFRGEDGLSAVKSRSYTGSSPHSLRGGGAIQIPVTDPFTQPADKGSSIAYRVASKSDQDTTAPAQPVVHAVNSEAEAVTGYAEALSTVTVKVGKTVLGTGKAASNGAFTVSIVNQAPGAVLSVIAADNAGNRSKEKKITVSNADTEAKRIAGKDRYETAVSISKNGWKKAETVVLATGADFPDALAGGPLAYKENAPILLTRASSLHALTEKEIERLEAKKVIILGSKGAVSQAVENRLKSKGLTVERIGGLNRFETAAQIAERLPSEEAIVAQGLNFPDALAVSPYAAKNGMPILLTRADRVPAETLEALTGKKKTIVVGSTGAVSDPVMKKFPAPVRYGGATRYETAKAITTNLLMGKEQAYAATGTNFPDALAGSVLAANRNAPILLVREKSIPAPTKDLLKSYSAFTIFGSQGAVSEDVKEELDKVLKNK